MKQESAARRQLPLKEIAPFCAQMAMLARAGVPYYEGIAVMISEAPEGKRKPLEALSELLVSQYPLPEAIERSGVLPGYAVNMLEIGERTGRTDDVLEGLAKYYEREYDLRCAITRAVTYPFAMIVIMLAVLLVLAVFIMPVFEGVLAQLGAAFSPGAKLGITAAGILSGVLLAALLLLAGWVFFYSLKNGPEAVYALKGKLLANAKLTRQTDTGRFLSVLAITLKCGLTIDDCVELCIPLMDCPAVREGLEKIKAELDIGGAMYEALEKGGLLRKSDLCMMSIGVRAGCTEDAAQQLADVYTGLTEDAVSSIISKVEPAMVAVMSIAAGGALLIIMMPLISILTSIG